MRVLRYFLVSALIGALPLGAAEVTFQSGTAQYDGASDTTLSGLRDNLGSLNYGHADRISVAGVPHGGMKQLGLIQFGGLTGANGVPAGTRISRATLELYKVGEPTDSGQYQKVAVKDLVINGYQMLKAWQAGEAQGETVEGAATFFYRAYKDDVPEFWGESNQLENGPVKGVDYNASAVVKAPMVVGEEGAWMRFDVTEFVQQWVDHPESNFGILLMARSSYIGSFFASCEASDAAHRPKLTIEY